MRYLPVVICLFAALPVMAEERTYSVTIDGHAAGKRFISFHTDSSGSTNVTIRADYKAGSGRLAFDYHGTETWKDKRLVRLEGAGSEDGRKGGITLVAGTDGYTLAAGVKRIRVGDEVWPTTGALLPDLDQKPLVVDVLTGDVLRAKVEKVGADRVVVEGKPVPVTRYRVTVGGDRWDVWYDADQRLVKRMSTRDGRTIIVQLTKIQKD